MNSRWKTTGGTLSAAAMVFAAAALAQSPTGATVAAPLAQGTGTVGLTGTVTAISTITGTAAQTGTVTAVSTITGTQVTTGTGEPLPIPTIAVPTTLYQAGGTGNFPFAHPAFERVWNRTDLPVKQGRVSRTWFWGPGTNTPGLFEQYNEAPAGNRLRVVQYFDKSRMELNNPQADQTQPFFVTNGLLTVELISGFIQVGEKDFTRFRPACIPMTGDFGERTAPTYFTFQSVSNTQAGDHPSPDRTGQRVTQTINRQGVVGEDAAKGNIPGVELVRFEPQTRHNIPRVFWDFLNSSGPVSNAQGQTANEQLITPWFFASGLPISEPYWTRATVAGRLTDVMIQAYERRALTYVPTNPAGFQVEMANIGQHYFDWRYRNAGVCQGATVGTPTAPVPAGTTTVVPGTPGATGTVPVGTGTPAAGTPTAGTPAAGTPTAGATQPVASPSPTSGGVPQPIPATPSPTP